MKKEEKEQVKKRKPMSNNLKFMNFYKKIATILMKMKPSNMRNQPKIKLHLNKE